MGSNWVVNNRKSQGGNPGQYLQLIDYQIDTLPHSITGLFEREDIRRQEVCRQQGCRYGRKDYYGNDDTNGQADSPQIPPRYFENKADAILFLPVRIHGRRDRHGVDLADNLFQERPAVLHLRLMLLEELLYIFIFHHYVQGFSLSVSAP